MSDSDHILPAEAAAAVVAPDDERGLEALLVHLQSSRGFDFHGYKRVSLARRISRRMTMLGIATYGDYLDFIQVHPDEIPQLFNMVLINVTAFYRDPAAWEALSKHIEGILAARAADSPIRVWSAGVASGEESYTLAMVFAELLGMESLGKRVKIYATDVDEDALSQARMATYPARSVEGLSPDLVAKYFTAAGSMFTIHKDLRRVVLFGRHDLLQDAPISRIDVLACRNALMYFNAEAQTRVLTHLHFALAPDGVLFLGKAEMLLSHLNLFTPVDLKFRLFSRTARSLRGRDKIAMLEATFGGRSASDDDGYERILRAAFEAVPLASVVLDLAGRVALTNRRAMSLLGLHPQDVGRPFQDLEISYRPVDLRTLLDQARTARRMSAVKAVERVLPSGERAYLDIEVTPLINATGLVVGTQLTFADASVVQSLHAEVKKLGKELARRASIDERRARDHQRRTPIDRGGAGDDQRGASIDQRRARNHERRTPVVE